MDSEAASQAEALLVREAVRLRDEEGLTAEEIAAVLEQFKKRVRIVAVVDSLKHLQKGGRLPAAVAIVGGALGIKPVLALKDGEIKLVDKGRGRPARWSPCSSSWTRSAVLTRATAIRCSTAIISSYCTGTPLHAPESPADRRPGGPAWPHHRHPCRSRRGRRGVCGEGVNL